MAVFADLPNELIIDIWSYVIAPEDVESLALVSKRVYILATPFLREHTRLKQQRSKICISFPVVGMTAADLLEKLLLNPRITLYINEFVIDNWAIGWDDQKNQLRSYPRGTMDLFKDAIRASSLIASSEVVDWVAQIKTEDEDPILALIVMQLAKLKKLGLSRLYTEASYYQLETLMRITQSSKAAIQPRLLTLQSQTDSDNQAGFSQPSIFSNLEADFDLLLGSEDETRRRLTDVFPTSIERVTLRGTEIIGFGALEEVVFQMARYKMTRLPNLKTLTFDLSNFPHYRGPGPMDHIKQLAEKCAEVGVRLSTWMPSKSWLSDR